MTADTSKDITIPEHASMNRTLRGRRPVNQYSSSGKFIKEYESASDAAVDVNPKHYKAATSNIAKVCKEALCELSAYGFYWAYADSPELSKD